MRRMPSLADIRPLVRPRPIQLDPVERRLSRANTVADIRAIARRRTPRAVFDYTDGGAEEETSMRRAREAFGRVEFIPRVLRDVSAVDPSTELFGERSSLPLVFAPTGFTRLMHTDGEVAVARVAKTWGFRARCQPWEPPRSRISPRRHRKCGAGSSSTCGATGRRARS